MRDRWHSKMQPFQGKLVRNTGLMTLGQIGRVALQGAYFVVIARALGVEGFGAFSGVVALITIVAPFGSLGAVNLMIRHIVRDASTTGRRFATAVKVTTLAGAVMTALLLAVAHWVAPREVPLMVIVYVALSDLLGARLLEVAGGVYTARQEMGWTAAFQLWLNAARLSAALILLFGPWKFTLTSWALVYLVSTWLVTGPSLIIVQRRFGGAKARLREFFVDWREGGLFSVSLSSQSVYNDVDKAMLARMSSLDAAGVYTAAYRVVDLAFAPMRALLAAAYPRFFQYGQRGLRAVMPFTRRISFPGLGYCLFVSLVLALGADVVPLILGTEYEKSVGALRVLSLLPLLKGFHSLAADSLTGAGYQGSRSAVQICIVMANVLMNLVLIPRYGYRGAVVASLLSDGLLAALLWLVVVKKIKNEIGARPTNP